MQLLGDWSCFLLAAGAALSSDVPKLSAEE